MNRGLTSGFRSTTPVSACSWRSNRSSVTPWTAITRTGSLG